MNDSAVETKIENNVSTIHVKRINNTRTEFLPEKNRHQKMRNIAITTFKAPKISVQSLKLG